MAQWKWQRHTVFNIAYVTEEYDIDVGAISISGFSSGAYMATQMHVAFSSRIMGVAMFAGGKSTQLPETKICAYSYDE